MSERRQAYVLVAPVATIFAGIFVAPFCYFFVISFWSTKAYKLVPTFTFANYTKTIVSYGDTLLFTMQLAFVVAALTTVLGFFYAYLIRFKAGAWTNAFLLVAMLTLFGGYLMKIYAWKTILGNQGALNSGLMTVGLIHSPITALFYTPGAVIVTLLHFLLPLSILPIYSSLRGVTSIELEAARDLGASPLRTMLDIVIPRCRSGLIGAFALCFLVASGDYVTPALVGGTMNMIGNVILSQFGNFFNWPLGSAMSFTTLAVSAFVVGVVALLIGRIRGS
jgi:spermidine/putrescine transport system permease protein